MSRVETQGAPTPRRYEEDPSRYWLEVYVAFLQGVFNFLPLDHCYHWEPDEESTRIAILGETPIQGDVFSRRPAITVQMGPDQTVPVGIDDMQSMDLQTHRRRSTLLVSGYLVVYTLAGNAHEARRLAHMVRQSTMQHRRLLESPGGFFTIARGVVAINSPSPPGALIQGQTQTPLVMVQVNIPFQGQWTWENSVGASPPQFRNIQQILGQRRAREYPYVAPVELETLRVNINTKPVNVRLIRGRYATRPATVEVGQGIDDFQQADLRPREEG